MMKNDIYSLVSLECRKDIRWSFFNYTLQEKEAGGPHNMSAFPKCSCGVGTL